MEDIYMDKLIIKPKEDPYVYMRIRITKELQEKYTMLATRTNHSRNELVSMALQFALDHMEIQDD